MTARNPAPPVSLEISYYGGRRDLPVGNTEVLAGMVAELIDWDVHRIVAADPYSAVATTLSPALQTYASSHPGPWA